jgi:hypothetical protein
VDRQKRKHHSSPLVFEARGKRILREERRPTNIGSYFRIDTSDREHQVVLYEYFEERRESKPDIIGLHSDFEK